MQFLSTWLLIISKNKVIVNPWLLVEIELRFSYISWFVSVSQINHLFPFFYEINTSKTILSIHVQLWWKAEARKWAFTPVFFVSMYLCVEVFSTEVVIGDAVNLWQNIINWNKHVCYTPPPPTPTQLHFPIGQERVTCHGSKQCNSPGRTKLTKSLGK